VSVNTILSSPLVAVAVYNLQYQNSSKSHPSSALFPWSSFVIFVAIALRGGGAGGLVIVLMSGAPEEDAFDTKSGAFNVVFGIVADAWSLDVDGRDGSDRVSVGWLLSRFFVDGILVLPGVVDLACFSNCRPSSISRLRLPALDVFRSFSKAAWPLFRSSSLSMTRLAVG